MEKVYLARRRNLLGEPIDARLGLWVHVAYIKRHLGIAAQVSVIKVKSLFLKIKNLFLLKNLCLS